MENFVKELAIEWDSKGSQDHNRQNGADEDSSWRDGLRKPEKWKSTAWRSPGRGNNGPA